MRALIAIAATVIVGCSSSSPAPSAYCSGDPRVEAFSVGIESHGAAGASIAIASATPSAVQQGLNEWTVTVTDSQGAPIDGTVSITSVMPDHGHASPTLATVTSKGDGHYDIGDINLSMRGVWLITISIASPTINDDATFTFCVDGTT